MSLWAKLGWSLLGLLVLASIGVMFLLHWIMGLGFAVFCAAVLWWVFGVLKKKTDSQIKAVSRALGLEYRPHPFRYASLAGQYYGYPVRVSYEGSSSFGLGGIMALTSGSPGWAALDISSLTVISLEPGFDPPGKKLIEPGPPALMLKNGRLLMVLPEVSANAGRIKSGLESLRRLARDMEPRERTAG